MSGEMFYSTDGKGRWYRKWVDSGGDEHKQRLVPDDEARLQLRYGDRVHGETDIKLVQTTEDDMDRRVRDSMRRVISEDILQDRKDETSLELQKDGGGVVRLQNYGGDSKDRGDKQEAISALYKRAKAGDEDAENKLDQLWKLTIPRFRELERSGSLVVVGCPKCNTGLDPNVGDCPVCGWNMYDKGYHKEFDEIVRGRRG